jgi:hypothetical protein
VKWSNKTISKAAWHIEMCENLVREWVQDKTIQIVHVAGETDPADIFTKEMRDGMHFRQLRDSFMLRLLDILSKLVLAACHARQPPHQLAAPTMACVVLSSVDSLFMRVLASSSFFRTLANILHLSSAGWQLLWCLHGFVPSSLLKSLSSELIPRYCPLVSFLGIHSISTFAVISS